MWRIKIPFAIFALIIAFIFSNQFYTQKQDVTYKYKNYVRDDVLRAMRAQIATMVQNKKQDSLETIYSYYLSHKNKALQGVQAAKLQRKNERIATYFKKMIGHKFNPKSNLDKLEWKKIEPKFKYEAFFPYSFNTYGFDEHFFSYLTKVKFPHFPLSELSDIYIQKLETEATLRYGKEIKQDHKEILAISVSIFLLTLVLCYFVFFICSLFIKKLIQLFTHHNSNSHSLK